MLPIQQHNLPLYSLRLPQYLGSVPHRLPSHRDWIYATNIDLLTINKWALLVLLQLLTALHLAVHSVSAALALHQPP
jgi:hypothetical protein